MMDLTNRQWVKHAVTHPFEGFEDMRWKKAGSMKYAIIIVLLWFVASVFYNRLYGFQFYVSADKMFNVIPYIVRTIVLFLTWVVGNWAVCTLLDGEGTMKNIFVYSAYALVPYVVSIYLDVFMSHFLIRDEFVFIEAVRYIGLGWSVILVFSAIKSVHQYSFLKTIVAIALTIAAMLIMLFLLVLLLSLLQQVYVFVYSIYTEIAYRLKV
ncbi:MAG: YIP1 family protein [Oscillospiraceae bacterium]|nr:YIP1 family protein [Oscillospiraceae bacterium]